MQCVVDYCLDPAVVKQAEDEEVKRSRILMQEELNKLETGGIEVVTDIREGDTVSEILREEEDRDVDLIVMPSHRKKGILERMMGPVSKRVMEKATRPVLIVRH